MNLLPSDIKAFGRAIQLALKAEKQGNLPIGAVISYENKIIAEGNNAIWMPEFNQNRHAEIEALRNVPQSLWQHAHEMTLVTTLEPCLMCFGAILLYGIGRILYGAADAYGGASTVIGCLPPFFETQFNKVTWIGPAYPEACDQLFARAMKLVEKRGESVP